MLADRHNRPRDAGISTVELVLIAPVLMLLVLVLVAFGQITQARSSLDGTARDAARAGALQRDWSSAVNAATTTASKDAAGICSGGNLQVSPGGTFEPSGMFTVTLSCRVKGLSMIGLGSIRSDIRATSTAPLDTFRRVVR
ncbi:TadE/TadG family type IV pilus assembly protein [Kitasatospora sp. NPDC093679]|uniref:TadE/TadG family type IV pilus assembly protein n=1 Tax=Kitasatospora sp. NPDC093679 TaxID=3154983 RepID=UPI003423AF00